MSLTEAQEWTRYQAYMREKRSGGPVPGATAGEQIVSLGDAQMPRMMAGPMLPADTIVVPSDASANVLAAANRQKLQWGSNVLICTGANDDVELNASLTGAGDNSHIIWMPGTYYVAATTTLANNFMRLDCAGVTLQPTVEAISALTISNGASYAHWSLNGPMLIDFGPITSSTPSTNSSCMGISDSYHASNHPHHFNLEGIQIQYSNKGVYFVNRSHLYTIKNVIAQAVAEWGFHIDPTDGATGVAFDHCWVKTAKGGFNLDAVQHLLLEGCEVNSTTQYGCYQLTGSSSGNLMSCSAELNTVSNAALYTIGGGIINIVGFRSTNNVLSGGSYGWIFRVTDGALLSITNGVFGNAGAAPDTFNGAATYACFSTTSTSAIEIRSSFYAAPTGAGGGTGKVFYDATTEVATNDTGSDEAYEGLRVPHIARATYDFSVHGGAVSTIGLGVSLPDNAIVKRCYYYQETAFTSGGAATVEFGYTGDTAVFVAQAAYNNAQYNTGSHDGVESGAASLFHGPLSGAKEIAITIGSAALTDGKLIIYLEYVISD